MCTPTSRFSECGRAPRAPGYKHKARKEFRETDDAVVEGFNHLRGILKEKPPATEHLRAKGCAVGKPS